MSSDLRTAIIENITIADFLRSEGYEVIPRGRKLTVKGHDSLVITPDKNVFTWNSRGFGGSVIDLYMGLHSCDARTAMIELRKQLPEYKKERPKPNQPHPAKPPAPKDKESVPLILPTEDKNKWRRVYAYLISTRKITPTIVKWLVQEKTIYPDERGNLCYLGRDGKGGINYCARKGTLTPRDGQKGYRNVVEGSDYQKRCVMNHSPSHTKLVVTEAAVDAWSFASMLEIHGLDHKAYTYLSLETTYEGPLGIFLDENPQIRTIYLAQDADEGGLKSRVNCRKLLEERGFTGKVIDKLPNANAPGAKDWNDALILKRAEMEREPVEQAPTHTDEPTVQHPAFGACWSHERLEGPGRRTGRAADVRRLPEGRTGGSQNGPACRNPWTGQKQIFRWHTGGLGSAGP